MKNVPARLLLILVVVLCVDGLPNSQSVAQEASPTLGLLGVSLDEWRRMSRDERLAHLASLSDEDRATVQQSFRHEVSKTVKPRRVGRKGTKLEGRRRPEERPRVQQILWGSKARGPEASGEQALGGSPQAAAITDKIQYDTNSAIGYFATGDFKGNRFDTAKGVQIPASNNIKTISVYMVPAPPPYFSGSASLLYGHAIKILGPGTTMGSTILYTGLFLYPGTNIIQFDPPLHFTGPNLHIGFADYGGFTYTYSFGISSYVYFYGTFRFAYYYNYQLVFETTYTFGGTSGGTPPFKLTTAFGGKIGYSATAFTSKFGVGGYALYFPYSGLVPAYDTMSTNSQGFHGETLKSSGTIIPIANRNFLVRVIPPEAAIFSDGFESGDTSAWPKTVTP